MGEALGKVILVVDDSASIRKEVKVILEKEGYSIREAGSAFGLFDNIDRYGKLADLILMDIMLNDEHGLDLVEKLRKVDRFRKVPVIMLTQLSDRETVTMAKMLGVDGYIIKPINPKILIERVNKAFTSAGE